MQGTEDSALRMAEIVADSGAVEVHTDRQAPGRSAENVPWPVVVADDDELARALVIQYLRRLHLQNPVREAVDGDQVCRLLSDPLLPPPCLLLLDLHMPGRSGLDVLRWLRNVSRLRRLPVVMLTGSAELAEVDEAYELGIVSYLVKPVGFGALQDVLQQLGLPWAFLPQSTSDDRPP